MPASAPLFPPPGQARTDLQEALPAWPLCGQKRERGGVGLVMWVVSIYEVVVFYFSRAGPGVWACRV